MESPNWSVYTWFCCQENLYRHYPGQNSWEADSHCKEENEEASEVYKASLRPWIGPFLHKATFGGAYGE